MKPAPHPAHAKKHPQSGRVAPTLTAVRSALSSGSSLFLDDSIDHRTAPVRRLRDVVDALAADAGGRDHVSAAELLLIRRAGMLVLQLEMQESRFKDLQATPAELDVYQRTVGALRRTLETLRTGLPRRARDITPVPSVAEYAARVANGGQA